MPLDTPFNEILNTLAEFRTYHLKTHCTRQAQIMETGKTDMGSILLFPSLSIIQRLLIHSSTAACFLQHQASLRDLIRKLRVILLKVCLTTAAIPHTHTYTFNTFDWFSKESSSWVILTTKIQISVLYSSLKTLSDIINRKDGFFCNAHLFLC